MAPEAIPDDYSEAQQDARRTWVTLTAFQRDCLTAIAAFDGDVYGLAIKEYLTAEYGENINHGRLYPNLDDLADADLITKGQRDKRTNDYDLTEWGATVVTAAADRLAEVAE